MKFCDKEIQYCLLRGGKIYYIGLPSPLFYIRCQEMI